eukprot:CAMPEP_0115841712 /NCGR_PEP_ID=MMETSP0287-20121206/7428_1 /TAXON_ID=412157 /ORGANISM="Chrysochromulina rotalis, Strain UIO044" /LENGTH=906 /DNA_ID=CAMNT_0003295363 /DNA_START=778 /DNA_END=3498 /DNA_ORIENTATION=-
MDRIEHRESLVAKALTTSSSILFVCGGCLIHTIGALAEVVSVAFSLSTGACTLSGVLNSIGHAVLAVGAAVGRSSLLGVAPLLGFADACLAIGRLLNAINYSARDFRVRQIGAIIGCVGAIAMLLLNFLYPASFAKVSWEPTSWQHILHPGNYVGLIGLLSFAGSLLASWEGQQLASSTFWLLGAHVRALHVAESRRFWMNRHNSQSGTVSDVPTCPTWEDAALQLTPNDCDVAICGASIAGLLMASKLGRAELLVVVIESRKETCTDARFVGVSPASRAILHHTLDPDLMAELEGHAIPDSIPWGAKFVNGICQPDAALLMSSPSPRPDEYRETVLSDLIESSCSACRYAKFPFPLRCMQSFQEAVLLKQTLRWQSVEAFHGWKLVRFGSKMIEQEQKILSEAVRISSSEVKTFCSKYIVGADGPGSTVSLLMQVKFDGYANMSRPMNTLLRSTKVYQIIQERFGHCHQFQLARIGVGMMMLVIVDVHRAMFNVSLYNVYDPSAQSNWTAHDVMSALLGTSDIEIVQESHYYWNCFIARRFSAGGAFLVGDAAHSWPPMGGTGGNTAYGDVTNLAWKLTYACQGIGGKALLESYSMERRQYDIDMALYVLGTVRGSGKPEKVVRFVAGPLMRYRLFRTILRNMWLRGNRGKHTGQHYAQDGLQFGIKLLCSPIIVEPIIGSSLPNDPPSRYMPIVSPGAYLPDYRLVDGTSVHDQIHHHYYSILVLCKEQTYTRADGVGRLRAAFDARKFPYHVSYISLAPADSVHSLNSLCIRNLYCKEAILIARPDFFLAWKFSSKESDSSEKAIDIDMTTLTGIRVDGSDGWETLKSSAKYQQYTNYISHLSRVFSNAVVPLRNSFPNAIACQGALKKDIIEKIRKRDATFKATTKVEGNGELSAPKDKLSV